MKSIPRKFILVAFGVTGLVILLWIALQPTLADRLEYFKGRWCIEQLTVNGRDTIPSVMGIAITFKDDGVCLGNITLEESVMLLPGLNTVEGMASWHVEGDQLVLDLATREAKIFEGKYNVDVRGDVITLTSKDVYIRAHVVKYRLPF